MDTYRNLKVWKLAGSFLRGIYRLTRALRDDERFVATPQLRRAAWSVHNNIVEGNARRGRAERRQFFGVAIASLAEASAMVDSLGTLYTLNAEIVRELEELRRAINGALFAMLKTRPEK